MSRRIRTSSDFTKLIATPLRPNRPDRPILKIERGGGGGGGGGIDEVRVNARIEGVGSIGVGGGGYSAEMILTDRY